MRKKNANVCGFENTRIEKEKKIIIVYYVHIEHHLPVFGHARAQDETLITVLENGQKKKENKIISSKMFFVFVRSKSVSLSNPHTLLR